MAASKGPIRLFAESILAADVNATFRPHLKQFEDKFGVLENKDEHTKRVKSWEATFAQAKSAIHNKGSEGSPKTTSVANYSTMISDLIKVKKEYQNKEEMVSALNNLKRAVEVCGKYDACTVSKQKIEILTAVIKIDEPTVEVPTVESTQTVEEMTPAAEVVETPVPAPVVLDETPVVNEVAPEVTPVIPETVETTVEKEVTPAAPKSRKERRGQHAA